MPLFEYLCSDCEKRFTFLSGVVAANDEPRCPRCGSRQLQKLISRVVRGRSDDQRMDDLAERMDAQDFDDPRALRRFAREMGREIGTESGEDMSDEIEELIENEANSISNGGNSSNRDDGTIY